MVKVGIIGATGYAGNELVRILLGHKDVELSLIHIWYQRHGFLIPTLYI